MLHLSCVGPSRHAQLDEKLREGVENEMAERQQGMTHQELQKALVAALPETFEVPETLLEEVRHGM